MAIMVEAHTLGSGRVESRMVESLMLIATSSQFLRQSLLLTLIWYRILAIAIKYSYTDIKMIRI
jgi:hypothetical protein